MGKKNYKELRRRPKEMSPKAKIKHRTMLEEKGLHKASSDSSSAMRSPLALQRPSNLSPPKISSPIKIAHLSLEQGVTYTLIKTPPLESPPILQSVTVKFDSNENILGNEKQETNIMDHRNYPLPRPFYHKMPGVECTGDSVTSLNKRTQRTKENGIEIKKLNSHKSKLSEIRKQTSGFPTFKSIPTEGTFECKTITSKSKKVNNQEGKENI